MASRPVPTRQGGVKTHRVREDESVQWWHDAVVYQVYPRSFRDSDGDGIGDLAGIESRLDHIVELGADALWLSPIHPSPLADFGYDVADYEAVDPVFGDLADLDSLVAGAHARGLRLLMDLVPCHTSTAHPWFAQRRDFYVWADGHGDGPPNNWLSAFGGPAWSPDPGGGPQWYLHSFYPEQADLDWRNPQVVEAMQDIVRFWLDRGVDGFRLDAIDRLVKDAQLRDDGPAKKPFALPLSDELARLDHRRSSNSPDVVEALAALRSAAKDALLVGEVFLAAEDTAPYLDHLDAAFAFELFFAPWEADRLREAITGAAPLRGRDGAPGAAWVLSNHDFPRLPDRLGAANARAAAVLALTLPGPTFVYQGDEIGQRDGPPGARYDRAGRDRHRHPLQWTAEPHRAGFTAGEPWLEPVDPGECNVAAQRDEPDSTFSLYRRLIALRRELGPGLELVDAPPGVLAYRRGREHLVAINTTAGAITVSGLGRPLLVSEPGALTDEKLAAHGAAVTVTDR
jgi:glycosidase